MAYGVWVIHFKSAGTAAQPSGSSQPGLREEKAMPGCAHDSLDGLSPRGLLRHSWTITGIRVELSDSTDINTSMGRSVDDGLGGNPVAIALREL